MSVSDLMTRTKVGVTALIAAEPLISSEVSGGVNNYLLTDLTNVAWPCVTVSFEGVTPVPMGGDTENYQLGFSAAVLIRDQTEVNQSRATKYAAWWTVIYFLFFQRPRVDGITITGAGEVYRSMARPRGSVVDRLASQYPNVVQSLELQFEAWIPRGSL